MASTTSYQRQQAPPYSENNYDGSDDDGGLNTDEEEEERRLSELHGEAADDDGGSGRKRKRTNNNDTTKLTEEDAAAAKEFEEKIRKKISKRPQFTPQLLTSGTKGLVYVRRSFPSRVAKFRTVVDTKKVNNNNIMDKRQKEVYKKRLQTTQINMAARYSSSLLSAYTDFARSLFPSLAPADVFLKIEDMGSKKEIKDFLQVMRDDVRKEYLLKVYNGDVGKVERLLSELEYGINVGGAGVNALMGGGADDDQEEVQYDDGAAAAPRVGVRADAEEMEEEEEEAASPAAAAPVLVPVSNPYKKSAVVNESNENAETSEVSSPDAEKELEDEGSPVEEKEDEEHLVSATNEEEEEEEAEFEEEELELTDKAVEEGATKDYAVMPDTEEAASQSINESRVDNTQETLTLLESQEDERFSQAMSDDAPVAEASPEEPEEEGVEENDDERFSQVNNTSKEKELDATQDESFSQEENTLDERFSQVVTDRVTFEEGTFTQENDGADDEDVQRSSAPLGQMSSTQLSMEY